MNPIVRHFSNLFFSGMLAVLFRFQRAAESKPVRTLIELLFGRLLASRYHNVIEMYGPLYGLALEKGLQCVKELTERPIRTIVDCGTGTGFVSEVLASSFPRAEIISIDAVVKMLHQAQENFRAKAVPATVLCGDISQLPLRDGAADLVVAQNTMPFLREFARVCSPGGLVVFADSSAKLVTRVASRAAVRSGMLGEIRTGTAQEGFFIIGRRFERENLAHARKQR